MRRVPVPRSPTSRVERGHASHSSARHLLSGAVVYLFKAKSSHAGAWSLGEESASQPWYWGAVGESIGSLQRWQVNRPAPQLPSPVAAMLPSVRDHGLVEPKVLNPSDELCTPTQSTQLVLRIEVGIDRAPVKYLAIVNCHDDEGVEVRHLLEVPAGVILDDQVFPSAWATSSAVAMTQR